MDELSRMIVLGTCVVLLACLLLLVGAGQDSAEQARLNGRLSQAALETRLFQAPAWGPAQANNDERSTR